jgi:hypothetical protein
LSVILLFYVVVIVLSSFFVVNALKGQKLLAQGIALGIHDASLSPCKGKNFVIS